MKNLSASIQARLKNFSKESGLDYTLVSRLYMQEGLLRRISLSSYSESFYLKGGLLLYSLSGFSSRPTQDIDLLGTRISGDESQLREIIKEILSVTAEDGLVFNTDSIVFTDITEGADYQGKRIKVSCSLGNMRTNLKLDIGFGDTVYPAPVEMDYPEILSEQGFQVYAYSIESVIAEKFETMIVLDAVNSRMKDFYDIYQILEENTLSKKTLTEAIKQAFRIRETVKPDNPAVFSEGFSEDLRNRNMWNAFLKRIKSKDIPFDTVLSEIRKHLEPIYRSLGTDK